MSAIVDPAILKNAVQRNCDIADARHAGDYTLCTYLLKMREFFRWQQGIDFQKTLTSDDVGDWLTQREMAWDELEEQDYYALDLGECGTHDAFAGQAINACLNKQGLVYSAGLGLRCRPLFFLAQLEQYIERDGCHVYIAGKELARDIESPPAMTQGRQVFIRKESLRRLIWEKVEEWRWSDNDSPMSRAIAHYDFDNHPDTALETMTEVEVQSVMDHEFGEMKAGEYLGTNWDEMLLVLPSFQVEIMLRAVRDHLADSLYTLPQLMQRQQPASIHFYFGNLTAMRKQLAPSLLEAYQVWHATGDERGILEWAERSSAVWLRVAEEAIQLYRARNKAAVGEIEALMRNEFGIR